MEAERVPIAPGQIRLSDVGIEFKVIKIEGQRVYCQQFDRSGEWNADLNYLEAHSKFVRNSE